MNKVHVKTGDTVVVINGKNRGRKGKVMQVSPAEDKVIVEGVNVVTKHVKPKRWASRAALLRPRARFTLQRFSSFAPSAVLLQE